MPISFETATRQKAKARIALAGPSGSGKTFTALAIANGLVDSMEKVALIDTENSSASFYADEFKGFMHGNLLEYTLNDYVSAFEAAVAAGAEVIVIDSISPAWDQLLKEVDDAKARQKGGNQWGAWADVTPKHNAFVNMIQRTPVHLIATMRVKTAWDVEEVNGKKKPVKIGLTPKQREGIEYEFDILGEIDLDHTLVITKSRVRDLADNVYRSPTEELGKTIRAWMDLGEDAPEVTVEDVKEAMEGTTEQQRESLELAMTKIKDDFGVDGFNAGADALTLYDWEKDSDQADKALKHLRQTYSQLKKQSKIK